MESFNKPIVILLDDQSDIKKIYKGNGDPYFSYNELLTIKYYINSMLSYYVDNGYGKRDIDKLNSHYHLELPIFKGEKINVNKKSFIYLMYDEHSNFFKIGISKKPEVREKTLQSEKPTIVLKQKWIGDMTDEKFLHTYFKDKRIRGEWFSLTNDDIDFINNYFLNK